MSVLLLDHDGLGTYNIAQYLGELGIETAVYHAHQLSIDDITELDPSHIVLSPSGGALESTRVVIQHIGAKKPILAVGLGFIAAIQVLGGKVSAAPSLHVGQSLAIHHTGVGLFNGLPHTFSGICYQHQTINLDNLPKTLDITAWSPSATDNVNTILAVKHQTWPLDAVLFHPEAVLGEQGHALLRNFLR